MEALKPQHIFKYFLFHTICQYTRKYINPIEWNQEFHLQSHQFKLMNDSVNLTHDDSLWLETFAMNDGWPVLVVF